MKHMRKLSTIEHVLDGNLGYSIRLEGSFTFERLRTAIARVQRKHPALRALLREERDGLYYEMDSAPEIPLRVVPRLTADDYERERQAELTREFAYDQPQLRVLWLRSEREQDLLFVSSHRICDGMSMLIIVREVLRSLYSDKELLPYEPVTAQDIIGDYRPPQLWKRKLKAAFLNGLLRLTPSTRQAPEICEHFLDWRADSDLSAAFMHRCKAEGVTVHAALVGILERALLATFGANLPKQIGNQIDPRRGRFSALKSDMVFFGGGSFKVHPEQTPDVEFWARVRAIKEEMRNAIEQEIVKIPSRFHFIEMLRPPSEGKMRWILHRLEALKRSDRLSGFALSNLGNVVLVDDDAPFRVTDLRTYVHSFKTRVLGMFTYTFNEEMRFHCVSDKKYMNPTQLDTFEREFTTAMRRQVASANGYVSETPSMLVSVTQ